MDFGLGDFVNVGTVMEWTFAVVVFVVRVITARTKGEDVVPPWIKKFASSNLALGLVLVCGLALSAFQAWHNHAYPQIKYQEEIIEKPVEKIVEKRVDVPIPCPTVKPLVNRKSPDAKALETTNAPPAIPTQICPNGICNGRDNNGTQNVNNIGDETSLQIKPEDRASFVATLSDSPATAEILATMGHARFADDFRKLLEDSQWTVPGGVSQGVRASGHPLRA